MGSRRVNRTRSRAAAVGVVVLGAAGIWASALAGTSSALGGLTIPSTTTTSLCPSVDGLDGLSDPSVTCSTTTTTSPEETTTTVVQGDDQAPTQPADDGSALPSGPADSGVIVDTDPGAGGKESGSHDLPTQAAVESVDSSTSRPGATPGPAAVVPASAAGSATVQAALPVPSPRPVAFSGPRSTLALFAELGPLALDAAALNHLLAPFPVVGPASYGEDFHEARNLPHPHLHQGVDILGAQGTPVIASGDGVVHLSTSGAEDGDPGPGGNAVTVTEADGTFFYYAHLLEYAPGLRDGTKVAQGDLLGGVGMTGDATAPHLHFEIHPQGGAAVDPVPYLDRWLSQASGTARALGFGPVDTEASLSALLAAAHPASSAAGASSPSRGSTRTNLTGELASNTRSPAKPADDPVPQVAAVSLGLYLVVRQVRSRRRREGPIADELWAPIRRLDRPAGPDGGTRKERAYRTT